MIPVHVAVAKKYKKCCFNKQNELLMKDSADRPEFPNPEQS
jgi:hypothetical protein